MGLNGDHYQVLEVDREASDRDIKRAFYRLLKANPPEQKPKEYQRLREAYDVLSDEVARKEYDSMSLFGEEIEALQAEAEAILNSEDPDYEEAERLLKKAIVLGPKIGILRNLLGRCFLEMEKDADALRQFEQAVRINPNNEAYLLNKGMALERLNRHEEAEAVYREVWRRDEEDYAAPRALAKLLHKRERSEEAHQVLDRAIAADGQVDFQDFFCLYDKIHFYLFDGKHENLRKQLDVVTRIAETPPDRQFAAFMLARSAAGLFDAKAFSLANDFMQAAKKLDPENELVQDLAGASSEASAVSDSVFGVMGDESFHFIAQELVRIRGGLFLGYLSEADAAPQIEQLLGVLDPVLDTDPDSTELKQSIRRLRTEHPAAYDLLPDLFATILRAPAATQFRAACPTCGEKVTAPKGKDGIGGCPFCNNILVQNGNTFQKVSSGGSTRQRASTSYSSASTPAQGNESVPAWVWIAGVIFILWIMSQC